MFESRLGSSVGRPALFSAHEILAAQRLVGNRAIQRMLGVRPRKALPLSAAPIQRHALTIDELEPSQLENDEEIARKVDPSLIQRDDLGTNVDKTSGEYRRVEAKATEIEGQVTTAIDSLASKGFFEKRDTKKYARHIGKAYKENLLMKPTGLVKVNNARALITDQAIADRPEAHHSWFRVAKDDWEVRHDNVGGGFVSDVRGPQGIQIRDLAAARTDLLKGVLVHEGTHFLQHRFRADRGADQLSKYKSEFRAYWTGKGFNDRSLPGSDPTLSDDDRATAIRDHIVGTGPTDTHTVYTEIRDWYWGLDAPGKRQVDDHRLSGDEFEWWHSNIHILRLLSQDNAFSDRKRLAEWKKLTTAEQNLILAMPLRARSLRSNIMNACIDPQGTLAVKLRGD